MLREHASFDILGRLECGGSLQLAANETAPDTHVITGTLTCAACAHAYLIIRGVPRMIPRQLARDVEDTVDAFGYQWQQANTALKDARFSSPEVFLGFIHPVEPAWFRDKIVLDGGCGIGRFTTASAAFGARLVIGVDLSASADVAFENTRHLPNVLIVQADILELPLQRKIDYAFSVAVLHHTADPRGAFLHMTSKVVPGGSVSAWVYGRENNGWIVHVVNPVRRVTSRLPGAALYRLSQALAWGALIPAVKLVYGPLDRLAPSAAKWLPYGRYLSYVSRFTPRQLHGIVHDHLSAPLAHYLRREDLESFMTDSPVEELVLRHHNGMSWLITGRIRARDQAGPSPAYSESRSPASRR